MPEVVTNSYGVHVTVGIGSDKSGPGKLMGDIPQTSRACSEVSAFTGTNLVLKFLCSPTPDSKIYCQFWADFCLMAVLAFAWITMALMQWHDFVALMCLVRLVCLTACQLITFTTTTIAQFVSDCELFCQTTWRELKLPTLLVTTGVFEMLSKWDELIIALAWLRLLCSLITQNVLSPSAIYCKKSILNAAR